MILVMPSVDGTCLHCGRRKTEGASCKAAQRYDMLSSWPKRLNRTDSPASFLYWQIDLAAAGDVMVITSPPGMFTVVCLCPFHILSTCISSQTVSMLYGVA